MNKHKTHRLFTGTYVDRELFQYIYNDIIEDFNGATFGKWVELKNLHFTYHFIGDVAVELVDEVKKSLADITKEYDAPLGFRGLSAFPNIKRPRVLHIPVYDSGILQKVYSRIGNALESINIKTDERKYKPHLTLQRIKDFDKIKFQSMIEKYERKDFGTMNSFRVSLIESRLTRHGPIYKVIQ